ncbi:solute carrier family 22 member 6-like [Grus japonensis]|uniref:Solute carrier family 22 member 6-like n=1 Tax=Grus japonensis TaxID=30415 RepID=A0ABC9XX41_GRUJA
MCQEPPLPGGALAALVRTPGMRTVSCGVSFVWQVGLVWGQNPTFGVKPPLFWATPTFWGPKFTFFGPSLVTSGGFCVETLGFGGRFSTSFAYYGLAMDLQGFGVDIYLSQLVFGAVDIPAKLASVLAISCVGRRVAQGGSLALAGICILANIIVPMGGRRDGWRTMGWRDGGQWNGGQWDREREREMEDSGVEEEVEG